MSDFASPPVRANKGSASHAIISGSEGAGVSPMDGSGDGSNEMLSKYKDTGAQPKS